MSRRAEGVGEGRGGGATVAGMVTDEGLLAAYDRQVRRRPVSVVGFETVRVTEPAPMLLLVPGPDTGWGGGVFWSDLTADSADAAIRFVVERFRGVEQEWEWKHYDYDAPPDLPDRLRAAGFVPDDAEALLIGEVGRLLELLGEPSPPGVTLRRVPVGVAADDDWDGMARLDSLVWGTGSTDSADGADNTHDAGTTDRLRSIRAEYEAKPAGMSVWVAVAQDGTIVCAARIEFNEGTEFASLWGGATHPDFRRRGIYRALVWVRAAEAHERGFRYLQVDASEDSRPILQRLGMRRVATTTPYHWRPGSA